MEPLSRNRDLDVNMAQHLHVFAICRRPEIDSDATSGLAIDNVGVDVHVEFGDSRSNSFRDTRGADFVSYETKKTNLSQ